MPTTNSLYKQREVHVCSSCNRKIEDRYCTACGIKKPLRPTSFKTLALDSITNILSLEKSGLGTLTLLLRKPERVVSNYMDGFRNHYQTPGRILFYTISFAAIYISLVDNSLGLSRVTTNMVVVSKQLAILIGMFLLFSLSSYFTFIRNRISYLHHLVAVIYLVCTLFIFYYLLLGLSFYYFTNISSYGGLILGLIAIHYYISNATVFTKKRVWWHVGLNAFAHVLMTYVVILFINITFYLVLQDPEVTLIRVSNVEEKLVQFIHHLIH